MDLRSWGIDLLAWDAWAPGLEDKDKWKQWLAHEKVIPINEEDLLPDANAVPPRLRRRCSSVSRMALETGLAVCETSGISGEEVNLIFCSRNGELITLKALFEDLCISEPLSPTRFSNSVHHTATGYFSLITKNRRISRTISGGDDCFACGLLETCGLLDKYPEIPVLLFYCDEFVPQPFDEMLEKPEFPFSVAMMLKRNSESPAFQVGFETHNQVRKTLPKGPDSVFSFLNWLQNEEPFHYMETAFGGLTWKR